jgi:hypothetical protein
MFMLIDACIPSQNGCEDRCERQNEWELVDDLGSRTSRGGGRTSRECGRNEAVELVW